MTESDIRSAIATRISALGSAATGIVRERGHYAASDDDFLGLVTNRTTGEIRGWIIRYVGWESTFGGGHSIERSLRYRIIGMLGAEEVMAIGGGNSEDAFNEMVEAVHDAINLNYTLNIGGETAVHSLLQAPTNMVIVPIGEKRVHLLDATLEVSYNVC